MSPREDAYARHQQARWLRPDAARWVRPDAARYLTPNADVTAVFPALERKYSPDQPRVPAGNPDGGQWTDGSLWGSLGLFQIKPREQRREGVQLAGEPPTGIGHNGGPPLGEPPQIPKKMPATRSERMDFARAAAEWVRNARRLGIAVDAFFELLDQVTAINRITDAIKSANDPPATLQELQDRATLPSEGGYENHHVVNQHASNRIKFGSRIDSPENVVRIPVLQHIEVSR
jgi:hypothetical protein